MVPAAPVPHVCRADDANLFDPGRRGRTRVGRLLERAVAPLLVPFVILGAIATYLATIAAMAGVKVSTGASPGAPDRGIPAGATFFVAGLAERGDTVNPVQCRSMSEVRRKLGDRTSYNGATDDALVTYFAEGGSLLEFARTVGAGATAGTLTLKDRSGGAGLNTLVLTAKNPGAWSGALTLEVVDGGPANTVTVYLYVKGALLEQYAEVATPAALAAAINAASSLVTAVDSGSVTAAPANNPRAINGGAAGTGVAFSAGTDDLGSVVPATYVAALARFGYDLGAGIVAIPGQTAANVGAGLEAHAKANGRLFAAALPVGQTAAQYITAATARRNAVGAEFGGIFGPWVGIPDGAGGTRYISPEGYVAACRVRSLRSVGPGKSPAGALAKAKYVTGVERSFTADEVDDLLDASVNPIIVKAGTVRLYGWRSLSTDRANYRQLTGRDVLNVAGRQVEDDLEEFVHDTFDGDGRRLGALAGKLIGRLDPYRRSGQLFDRVIDGEEVDPGYIIDVGAGVNTPETLANDEVHAAIGLRVSPTGETIYVTISKVPVDASL